LIRRLPYASYLDQLDRRITDWMAHYGLLLMRVALGVIFFWFGALKLVPGLSPAEDLVRNTLFVDPQLFQPVLAVWEMLIGFGLITGFSCEQRCCCSFCRCLALRCRSSCCPQQSSPSFPMG
jgi:hypothetical protein